MNLRRKNSQVVTSVALVLAAWTLWFGMVGRSCAEGAKSVLTLDQLLIRAMDNNPDIITARAKVTLAEAELRNARFEVAHKLVACWNEVEQQKTLVEFAAQRCRLAEEMRRTGGKDNLQELQEAKKALIDAEAKLASARNELDFLAGKVPPAVAAPIQSDAARSESNSRPAAIVAPIQIPHGPMVEKIRQQLAVETGMEFTETPIQDVAAYLKERHGIEIQLDNDAGIGSDMPITLSLNKLPLGAALQAWDDKFQNLKLVVRDYGILVTSPDRAREAGYMPLVDFARQGPTSQPLAPQTFATPEKPKDAAPAKSEAIPSPKPHDPFGR